MSMQAANLSLSWIRRLTSSAYRNRRRLATGSAIMVAFLLGYYAVAGNNGITVYKQKRIEDRQLAKQIDDLKQENARLQAHIEHLKDDPDAIEHEAREKLHYAKPGEVIYTLRDAPDKNRPASNESGGSAGAQAVPGTAQPANVNP